MKSQPANEINHDTAPPAMDHRGPPSTSTAFNKLPIEINQLIAKCLIPNADDEPRDFRTTELEVNKYRLICHATNNAIAGDRYSFWRVLFRERFALAPGGGGKKSGELAAMYQRRSRYLRRAAAGRDFKHGGAIWEQKALEVLRDLINESFHGPQEFDQFGDLFCKNQVELREFIRDSKLIYNRKRVCPAGDDEEWGNTLAAVRLMCSQLIFEMDGINKADVIAMDDAQEAVYAPTNDARLYDGPKKNRLNVKWMVQCFDFFRRYMACPHSSNLYNTLGDLEESELPTAWDAPLSRGSYPLSRHWKGTYAYLEHPILKRMRRRSKLRSTKDEEDLYIDLNIDEGKIQSLHLNFLEEGHTVYWPDSFEETLDSTRDTLNPTTRAQHSKKNATADAASTRNIQFTGWGEDLEDTFYATGWLNPLPDQCEIPGWQRVTFMKHFDPDPANVDDDNLWAYEGVVLPGGKFILGRWWYANDEVNYNSDYNGPFILWATSENEDEFPDLPPNSDDEDDEDDEDAYET